MKATLALLAVLAGCTATQPVPQRGEVFAHIKLVDELPPRVLGRAKCLNGVCEILILRSDYPRCITHEVRHGFEGDWHGSEKSIEDCVIGE